MGDPVDVLADPVTDLQFGLQQVRRVLGNSALMADNSPWTAATHTKLLSDIQTDVTTSAALKKLLTDVVMATAVLNTKTFKAFGALGVFAPQSDETTKAMLDSERTLAAAAAADGTTPETLARFADTLHDTLAQNYEQYLSGTRTTIVDDLSAAIASM